MTAIMTAKQRVIEQIAHRETSALPYTLRFEEPVGRELDAYYGSPAWRHRLVNAIEKTDSPVASVSAANMAGSGETEYTDPYGTRWRVDRRPYHTVAPALTEPTLRGYSLPAAEIFFTEAWRRRAEEQVRSCTGRYLVASCGLGLFERSWALRGFEQVLIDSVSHPGFYAELLEVLTEHQLAIVEELLRLEVDGIMFSDDWGHQQGMLLSPESWREFFKPRLARLYARVRAAGKTVLTHCCGDITPVIADLIEIGLDVLESVQPEAMDPYALKAIYGDRLTFWGALGSQSTIQFNRPESIRAEVRRLGNEMGRGGGYILAPAKPLQPGTPVENAAAVVESFLEIGGQAVV
jgi:uroporphyrinogen decarboxylase